MAVSNSGFLANKREEQKRRRAGGATTTTQVEDRLLAAMQRQLKDGTRFGTISVEALAREAGISRATFYIHFANKGELTARLLDRLTEEIADSAGEWFTDNGEADIHMVRQALTGIIGTFKRHQAVLAAVADTSLGDPTIAAAHQKMMSRLCSLSRDAVLQVHAQGRCAFDNPQKLADVLTWVIELYCARFIADCDGDDVGEVVDLFTHIAGRAIFTDAAG